MLKNYNKKIDKYDCKCDLNILKATVRRHLRDIAYYRAARTAK